MIRMTRSMSFVMTPQAISEPTDRGLMYNLHQRSRNRCPQGLKLRIFLARGHMF